MDYVKRCIEQNKLNVISDFIQNLDDINEVLIPDEDCNFNLLHFVTGLDSVYRDDAIKLIIGVDEIDINKHSGPGSDYFTAAHIAACYGYENTLRLLLENGADPYLLDRENNTVWDIAAIHNNHNCIKVIEDEVNRHQKLIRKEIDDSIYYSLNNFTFEDENDETLKSLSDQQSVIYVKAVEKRLITKVEEKLCQKPSNIISPPSKPSRLPTPRKSPSKQSPLRNAIPIKTPSKDSPKKVTPFKDVPFFSPPPRKSPPKKSPPSKRNAAQKERKPKISTKVDSLNETIYTDEDFNVTLIESHNETILEPIDPKLAKLTDFEVRQQLKRLGQSPGPINQTTRNAYLRKLQILKSVYVETDTPTRKQLILSPFKPLMTYSPYINAILNDNFNFDDAKKLEIEFVERFFSNPIGPTDFFVYLILDPRKLNSTSDSIDNINKNSFVKFLKSIFYIGKGKNNRPYMHLYEAAAPAKNNKPISDKVKRITEIWDQGFGVVSLHIVFAMSSNEAFARECLMIDAIGIDKLTNIRPGQQKIPWPEVKRMTLGTYLIHKAFQTLEINGTRQIRRADIKTS